MFWRTISAAALLCAVLDISSSISEATAAPASSSSSPGMCASLKGEYTQIEKRMAERSAEGLIDDSAPRATMRAAQDTADLNRAQLVITLLQASHCALPDHAASEMTYLLPAMTCRADRLKAGPDAPSCKMETWQPSK